jgi:Ca-activated chloride channel family protein
LPFCAGRAFCDEIHIIMTFLTPLSFLLLALILPIVALYFLKLRRQEHIVSSTYLWRRFVRDVEANAPWQRLRRNLLLFLQILFMLALIFALTRPATTAEGGAGQTTLLILDASASMQATDVGGGLGGGQRMSRFEAAKAIARDLVANLPDDTQVTLIAAAGGEAELLASASRNRRQVLEAIDAAQVTNLGSDLGPALSLAEAIVAREPSAEIVLISDGALQLPESIAPVRFISVGQSGENQALSMLSVTPTESGELALFAQVRNYGQQAMQRRLVVEVDGAPYTAFDLELPAKGFASLGAQGTPPLLPATAQTISAYLAPGEEDVFTLDDRLWAVVRSGGPIQAMMMTRGNFFLQTALNLLNARPGGPELDLTISNGVDEASAEGTSAGGTAAEPSFYIFDAYIPEALPAGNLLFIAPPQSVPGLFEVLGQAQNPRPRPVQMEHPLLENVNLAETQILTTTVVSAEGWGRTLVAADVAEEIGDGTLPLLLAGEVEGRRVVVLAFDLHQSDLPLRPAFPILVANMVNYLAPEAANLVPAQLAPGEALSLALPPEVNQVRLTGPDGRVTSLPAQEGRVVWPSLNETGLYTLAFEQTGLLAQTLASTSFAINFSDPLESAISPQTTLPALAGARQEMAASTLPPAHREWWRPLAMVALGLLVVEWLVYRRGKLRQYWSLARQRVNIISS